MSRCAAALAVLGLIAAPAAAQTAKPAASAQEAQAQFVSAKGERIGTATLVQTQNGVLIEVDLRGLPPGTKAFHIHAVGKCEAADGFKSAGDHFAPKNNPHGYMSDHGPHAGDLPNQTIAADGTLKAQVFNPNVTLGSGATSLFDSDGSALVLHADADDYKSQPSGNAGGRIACAVIAKG